MADKFLSDKIILKFCVIAISCYFSCFPSVAQNRASPVEVNIVISEPLIQTMPVIGRFVARESGIVATRIAETVSEMFAPIGKRVKKGEVLAKLSADRLRNERKLRLSDLEMANAQIAQEIARIEKIKQSYKRILALRGSSAFRKDRKEDIEHDLQIGKSLLRQAKADMMRAKAKLSVTDIALKDSEIKAPYHGVVINRHTVVGNYARVGDPIITLLNDEDLEIEADVPSIRAIDLNPGTLVTGLLQHGRTIQAKVRVVVPQENVKTRTRAVRLLPTMNGNLIGLAGNQTITLQIPIAKMRDIITVHKDAIITKQNKTIVYVVQDGKVMPRVVKTGDAVGSRLEVINGLIAGELVVVRGNERLRPGELVKPINAG